MNRGLARISLCCVLLAFSSLCYEFLLAQLLSIMGGHTVFYYCLTIGLYIFALGLGTLRSTEHLDEEACLQRLFWIEISLAVIGGTSPLWSCLMDRLIPPLGLSPGLGKDLLILLHSLMILVIGYASGMELPLLLRIAARYEQARQLSTLLVLDYLASFLGAISFPLWMFPNWGLVQSALLLGILNLSASLLLMPKTQRLPRSFLTLALSCSYGIGIWHITALESWLSQQIIRTQGL